MRFPNLELLEYKAKQYFFAIEKNKELYTKASKNKRGHWIFFEVEVFKQVWGSTCLGFDVDENGEAMFGGQMITDAYTTVFYEPLTETYIVFFGDNPCYQVQEANEKFLNDLKLHQLEPLSKAKKLY